MIKLKNASKIYKLKDDEIYALKDVSISFDFKELVCIIGPNGSGKSTFINILSGLDTPSSGILEVNGTPMTSDFELEMNDYMRNTMSIIVPSTFIYSQIGTKELVDLPNIIQNQCVDFNIDKIRTEIDVININRKFNSLSSGQRQRVCICAALNKNFQVIYADEPTSNLDEEVQTEIFTLFKQISKNKLVIMVTHNEQLARKYADRIVVFREGHIVSDYSNQLQNNVLVNSQHILIANPEQLENQDFKLISDLLVKNGSVTLKINKVREESNSRINRPLLKEEHVYDNNLKKYKLMDFIINFYMSGKSLIFSKILFSLIVILFSLLSLALSNINSSFLNKVLYEGSGYKYISYEFCESSDTFNCNTQIINKHIINNLSFNIVHSLLIDRSISLNASGISNTDFFSPSYISGIAIIKEDGIELLSGSIPLTGNEYVITDYIASYFVEYGYFESNSEIIGSLINLDGFSFIVSGISSTDYLKYNQLIDADITKVEDVTSIKEFQTAQYQMYNRLYSTESVFNSNSNLIIHNVKLFTNDGLISVGVQKIPESINIIQNNPTGQTGLILSNSLYNTINVKNEDILFYHMSLGYSDYNVKDTLLIGLPIASIYEDDDIDTNIIYVNDIVFDALFRESKSATKILVYSNSSIKDLDEINAIGFKSTGLFSSDIYQTTYYFSILKKMLFPILMVSCLLIVANCFFFFSAYLNNRSKYIGLLKTYGMKKSNINFINYVTLGLILLFEIFIINFIFTVIMIEFSSLLGIKNNIQKHFFSSIYYNASFIISIIYIGIFTIMLYFFIILKIKKFPIYFLRDRYHE